MSSSSEGYCCSDGTGLSDEAAAQSFLNAIRCLSKDVGIPAGFKELGAKEKTWQHWLKMRLKMFVQRVIQVRGQKTMCFRFIGMHSSQ